MKKYFFIVTLLCGCCLHAISQYSEGRRIDSLKIDSLKKRLPLLKDSVRIDVMELICAHYGVMAPIGGFKYRDDSIRNYAIESYNEAKVFNYKRGIAFALLNLLADSVKEKNILEAIRIGEEINNDELLGFGYYNLAMITDASKDFQQHVEDYKKAIYHFHKAGNKLREAEVSAWLSDDYSERGE